MASPALTVLLMAAMMVAMMLPSVAPALWRYHRHIRAVRLPRAAQRTTLFAAGYVGVCTAINLAVVAASTELPTIQTAPWLTATVVLCAGVLQCSQWKAKQLLRCRHACAPPHRVSKNVAAAWRDGCRLGVDCGLSCSGPMAVLLAAGLTDTRMMVVITVAITAERVGPAGVRIARLTGALAVAAGVVAWMII